MQIMNENNILAEKLKYKKEKPTLIGKKIK
jgi:hypothetical protein